MTTLSVDPLDRVINWRVAPSYMLTSLHWLGMTKRAVSVMTKSNAEDHKMGGFINEIAQRGSKRSANGKAIGVDCHK